MRIGIRRGLVWAVLVMLLLSICGTGAAATEPTAYVVDTESAAYKACDALAEGMEAAQILVYDSTNDKIIYAKSVEGGKLYPASTTKLFSTYVALQYLKPDEVITAGDELELVQPGSSVAYVGEGNQLTAAMLVEAMLLPSGNDAAMVLAAAAGRRIAGDESLGATDAVRAFVEAMNQKAEELGFEKTHFSNPDGFHVGSHYTCVSDMARIARLALKDPTISKYMTIHEEDVIYESGHSNHWTNTNLLLDDESQYYRSDAVGMKTGYTSQAGYCLMSAFKKDGRTIVIGVFGYQDKNARFADVAALLDAI